MKITPITDSQTLAEFCANQAEGDFITVDTEFIRERTFYPQLCLIQVAGAGGEAVIDALAEGLDLTPFYDLLQKEDLVKVFHAARQDLEIFFQKTGKVPHPLFDSQVAAMVCGFGDQVGYEALVSKVLNRPLDKSSRFTDWAARPLTDKQLSYALGDVTHLKDIYLALSKQLEDTGRASWLDEEMSTLTSPTTYDVDPRESWRRLKTRGGKPKFLAVLREVAAWRETEARTRDIPRNRILRDDSLLDLAGSSPKSVEDLARMRGISKGLAEGKQGKAILEAVARGLSLPRNEMPSLPRREPPPPGIAPLTDLLKVLLKLQCETYAVATRMVASGDDLERVAMSDQADVPALKGWRLEVFGQRALDLKHGRIALSASSNGIEIIDLQTDA